MIFEYLKRLSRKSFSKFSVVIGICGFITFYLGYDPSSEVAKFIIDNLLYVSLLFLIISSYQVWRELKLELDEIKKNPVDYKVTAKLQKVFIDLDEIKKGYKTKEEITKLLEECYKGKATSNNPFFNPVSWMGKPNLNKYLDELDIYENELKKYLNRLQENFSQWSMFCDLENIYVVDFYIESIGNKSDKNIDVEILLESNSYIQNLSKLESYPDFLEVPEKPKAIDIPVLNSGISNIHNLNRSLYQNINKDAYRKFKEFNKKFIYVNLRDMNVGDDIPVFKEKVLIELPKKEEIKIVIKSESSNAKIEKTVEFEIEQEPVEYYYYLKSQLDE
ncbi:MAG: hypothetical protein ACI8TE_000102 [Francisella sp.]